MSKVKASGGRGRQRGSIIVHTPNAKSPCLKRWNYLHVIAFQEDSAAETNWRLWGMFPMCGLLPSVIPANIFAFFPGLD